MKFRYARHTDNLNLLIDFYTKVIGLEVLGSFTNHSNYNGVFLGYPNLDWHIEFTESNEKANHCSDKDDLMVFYLNSTEELNTFKKKIENLGIIPENSQNPYWQKNGIEIKDPDGFGIILTLNPNN